MVGFKCTKDDHYYKLSSVIPSHTCPFWSWPLCHQHHWFRHRGCHCCCCMRIFQWALLIRKPIEFLFHLPFRRMKGLENPLRPTSRADELIISCGSGISLKAVSSSLKCCERREERLNCTFPPLSYYSPPLLSPNTHIPPPPTDPTVNSHCHSSTCK